MICKVIDLHLHLFQSGMCAPIIAQTLALGNLDWVAERGYLFLSM